MRVCISLRIHVRSRAVKLAEKLNSNFLLKYDQIQIIFKFKMRYYLRYTVHISVFCIRFKQINKSECNHVSIYNVHKGLKSHNILTL